MASLISVNALNQWSVENQLAAVESWLGLKLCLKSIRAALLFPLKGLYFRVNSTNLPSCPIWQSCLPPTKNTPLLLFEVLSPSTRIRDFGEKLPCYKQIPSLQHILYLETDNVKVFHFQRREDRLWLEGIYTDKSDKIVLPYGTITLGELYVD